MDGELALVPFWGSAGLQDAGDAGDEAGPPPAAGGDDGGRKCRACGAAISASSAGHCRACWARLPVHLRHPLWRQPDDVVAQVLEDLVAHLPPKRLARLALLSTVISDLWGMLYDASEAAHKLVDLIERTQAGIDARERLNTHGPGEVERLWGLVDSLRRRLGLEPAVRPRREALEQIAARQSQSPLRGDADGSGDAD